MWNFSAWFLRSTLGKLKEKYDWQDLTISISPVRNNFIKNLLTAKSREFKSLFFTLQVSRPYHNIGIHLVHILWAKASIFDTYIKKINGGLVRCYLIFYTTKNT